MNEASALADALATEHAAIYAYGVLGARLDDPTRQLAQAAFDAHRARRDDLLARLRSRRLPTPGPAASYDVLVTGRTQALTLAVRVETEVGVRWRDLVAVTDDRGLRGLAVHALQDSAVRAAQWRKTAGLSPVTVALPGRV
ncbi:MAG: hypothetical protein JWM02_2223 [Frankiales bacterium]|nr:hypothetical protein [Frankiales bacterium]